jgi:hypothetical protein
MLQFLSQDFYEVDEKGQPKFVQSLYYQKIYKGNLKLVGKDFDEKQWTFLFMLRAIK